MDLQKNHTTFMHTAYHLHLSAPFKGDVSVQFRVLLVHLNVKVMCCANESVFFLFESMFNSSFPYLFPIKIFVKLTRRETISPNSKGLQLFYILYRSKLKCNERFHSFTKWKNTKVVQFYEAKQKNRIVVSHITY